MCTEESRAQKPPLKLLFCPEKPTAESWSALLYWEYAASFYSPLNRFHKLLKQLPLLSAEDDVMVPDRVPEEILREDSGILHLEEHLSAAQVPSVLVLQEGRLLAEHAPEVCRGLEDSYIAFCHLPVNGDTYSGFEMCPQ